MKWKVAWGAWGVAAILSVSSVVGCVVYGIKGW